MESREGAPSQAGESLEILVFAMGGVYCGIAGELVSRMTRFTAAGQPGMTLRWLTQILSFGDREVVCQNPMVVTLKETGAETGLVIEQPLDLIKVPLKTICPLPPVFSQTGGGRVFWGGLVMGEKVVLLIDPDKLLRSC